MKCGLKLLGSQTKCNEMIPEVWDCRRDAPATHCTGLGFCSRLHWPQQGLYMSHRWAPSSLPCRLTVLPLSSPFSTSYQQSLLATVFTHPLQFSPANFPDSLFSLAPQLARPNEPHPAVAGCATSTPQCVLPSLWLSKPTL